MPLPVEGGLVTVTDLENHLHRTISTKDDPAAQADPNDLLIVKGIALRIAAQWFTNPEDRAQYAGPEGLSYTASPQMLSRIMGEADRRTLTSVQIRYAPGFA